MGVAGLLFVASADTAQGTNLRTDVSDLAQLVSTETRRADDLETDLVALRRDVDDAAEAAGAGDALSRTRAREVDRLAPAAGMTDVTGAGVVVTLDDAPDDPAVRARADSPDDLLVHQQDVQAVVNAMWLAGAEAVMLMDQRVISTSAVRCVGNTLSLHGTPYSPPYVVTAVGDPDRLSDALDRSAEIDTYLTYVEAYGLGYTLSREDSLDIPAYVGPSSLQYARIAEEPTG